MAQGNELKGRAANEWAAMPAHRIEHDGNPELEWCLGNVVGCYDARSNVYPRKPTPEQKINAAIALIMGIVRCMAGRPERGQFRQSYG